MLNNIKDVSGRMFAEAGSSRFQLTLIVGAGAVYFSKYGTLEVAKLWMIAFDMILSFYFTGKVVSGFHRSPNGSKSASNTTTTTTKVETKSSGKDVPKEAEAIPTEVTPTEIVEPASE